jgi:hypothetical protein
MHFLGRGSDIVHCVCVFFNQTLFLSGEQSGVR